MLVLSINKSKEWEGERVGVARYWKRESNGGGLLWIARKTYMKWGAQLGERTPTQFDKGLFSVWERLMIVYLPSIVCVCLCEERLGELNIH